MSHGRVNVYGCKTCSAETVTRDIHQGTTPFMMKCPKCPNGLAQSYFYKVHQFQDAEILWVRPTTGDVVNTDHVRLGGLIPFPASRLLEPIVPQIQPNRASCMATAFSMVIGVPVAEMIEQIGHDGMGIGFPSQQGSKQHIGFHIQEITGAMLEREYAVVPIEPLPVSRSGDDTHQYGPNPFFASAMEYYSGVLCGRSDRGTEHAVAWSVLNKKSTDPYDGRVMSEIPLVIRTFYAVIPKSNRSLDCGKLY